MKMKVEKKIQSEPDRTHFVRMCPYCNNFYMLSMITESLITMGVNPKYCGICYESDPFYKIHYSLEKVRILHKLSVTNLSINENTTVEKVQRVLLEQCVVNLATGFEVFFRDIFAIGMNLKFVKNEHSLISKFYKESKNEFLNIGKMDRIFKEELNVDLKSLFNEEIYSELKIIMHKRHAIVHNNGLVDKKFLTQSGIECNLGKMIPISSEEIEKYLATAEAIVKIVKQMFDQLFFPYLKERIDTELYLLVR
ncbi:HEPN domain-containing protein [Methanosarcina flavescens]|nr:HEPN domain-containing protein [Methanosarcina flavescens]